MERVGDILKRQLPNSSEQPINHSHSVEPEYNCPICKDAGFVHPLKPDGKPDYGIIIPCECQEAGIEEGRKKKLLELCDLPFRAKGYTLENFKLDKRWDSLAQAKQAAIDFADNDGEAQWLIYMGKRDTGKTHLAIGICRRWIARGRPAKYIFVPQMLDDLREGYNQDKQRESSYQRDKDMGLSGEWEELPYEAQMRVLKEIDLLVLDDLGAQVPTAWAMEKLMMIIDYRNINGLSLVVTSNKAINNLPRDDEGRIGSRLLRFPNSTIITIDSDEYRTW